jgi:WD40 repeat protein
LKPLPPTASACLKCGRPTLPSDPRGLCARCLLAGILDGADSKLPRGLLLPHPFGAYELLEEIARGGMGIVYRARQTQVNRCVAVKVLASGVFAATDFVRRFRTEAEAVASLEHPNIVPIYEVGECEGQPFFSMKLAEGGTLAGRIHTAKGPIACADAVALMMRLASAVHFAHQHGILHRDIKPGNVLLDAQGEPMLTDFGLAKLVEKDSTLTRTLAVLGTPSYMSPEQARGDAKRLTTAVDVYGLGAVFYELLTGHPPFAGGTTMETVQQVLDKEPRRPTALRPDTDRDLETICLKCLEKDPSRRYASAEALAEDLKRWQRHETVSARPTSAFYALRKMVRRHRTGVAAVASIVLLLVAGVVLSWRQADVERDLRERAEANERTALEARRDARLEAEQRRMQLVRLHVAAGTKLVEDHDAFMGLLQFVKALRLEEGDAQQEEPHRIRFSALLRTAPRLTQVWAAAELVTARFSPDGTRVVCGGAKGGVQIFDAKTGAPVRSPIQPDPSALFAWFTPDGDFLGVVDRLGRLRHWRVETGEPAGPLLPTDVFWHQGRRYFDCVDYSADGRRVAAVMPTGVQVFDVATGGQIGPLLAETTAVHRVRIHPNGRTVAIGGRWPSIQMVEVNSGRTLWMLPDLGSESPLAAFSPDGTQLVTTSGSGNGDLDIWDAARGERVSSTVHLGAANIDVRYSLDGEHIATASSGVTRLVHAPTGRPWHQSTTHGGPLTVMDFHPDGRRLASAGYDQIVRILNVDGVPAALPNLRHAAPINDLMFSRDGRQLLTASSDGTVRLWGLTSGYGERLSISTGDSSRSRVAYSHDGKCLLTLGASGRMGVYGSQFGELLYSNTQPPWVLSASFNRDGSRVAIADANGNVRLWDLAEKRDVYTVRHTAAVRHVEFSPDCSQFLTASDDGSARLWNAWDGLPAAPAMVHGTGVKTAAFSTDGHRVITGDQNGTLAVWETQTGTLVRHVPTAYSTNLASVALNVDGRRVLTLGQGASSWTQLWDGNTGEPIGPRVGLFSPHRYPAVFSPDGRKYLLLFDANSVAIMGSETGQRTAPLLHHERLPVGFVFSLDGRMVLTCSDNEARLWDVESGEPLTPPLRHRAYLTGGAWNPNGKEIATYTEDGSVQLWDVSPIRSPVAELERQAELLAAHRLDARIGAVPLTSADMIARWRDVQKAEARPSGGR